MKERHKWSPQFIIVDPQVAETALTREIVANCPGARVVNTEVLPHESDEGLLRRALGLPDTTSPSALTSLSRRSLLLWDSAQLTQPMATGPAWERRCFNFMKILPYVGTCTYNCSYCWFKDPVLIPRVNVRFLERLPEHLAALRREGRTPMVFTFTHYKTDCFGLEHITGLCRRVAEVFEHEPGFYVQFLTKSNAIDSLLMEPRPTKALVSFSINPTAMTSAVDLGTATVPERIDAARRLTQAGYSVALRVDPMMLFDGWEAAYRGLAHNIVESFTPSQVTLGTPRFQTMDEAKNVVATTVSRGARSFMEDQLPLMEMSKPGTTEKEDADAYFKSMSVSYSFEDRKGLYANMVSAFQAEAPHVPLGLCEEGPDMWDALGLTWTGDRTRDCSCNFVIPSQRAAFTREDVARVEGQMHEARVADGCATPSSSATAVLQLGPTRTAQ